MILTGAPTVVDAKSLLDLVSPGELSKAHQSEHIDCTGCHKTGNKSAQNGLCLDCHAGIKEDIDSGRGLHGRHSIRTNTPCSACHTEHQGSDADIGGLQSRTFDHALTDFELVGAHASLKCTDCHEEGVPRREAPDDCAGCHDSPHESRGLPDCVACHEQTRWANVSYKHTTPGFKLSGAHDRAKCIACHGISNFETKNQQCVDCHAFKDSHAGLFGTKCDDCHGQSEWSKAPFDHEKQTGYALVGGHQRASCHACHRFDRKLPEAGDCYACHKRNDIHAGANGNRCADCHDEKSWTVESFDHEAVSGFALKGRHRTVACSLCHKAGIEAKLETGCVNCHEIQDAHAGALGRQCADCHGEQAWDEVDFDHDRDTHFELRQSHRKLKCRACHAPGRTWDKPPRCVACHEKENVHGSGTSLACDDCHDEIRWSRAGRFHHDLTDVPLLGMHGLALCESCHLDKNFAATDPACESCHEEEDPHGGAYKAECGDCHNPNAWSSWRFNHDQTGFSLEGAHGELRCRDCHDAGHPLNKRNSVCLSCHLDDDIHNGRFGRDCAKCHNGTSFKDVDIRTMLPGSGKMVQ